MAHKLNEIGISKQIGAYSDTVEVGPNHRWLYSAGTPGLTVDGKLPEGIVAQTEQVWANIIEMLKQADMSIKDLVKVTTYLTNEADTKAYAQVRARVLDGYKPAFMLAVIPHLIRPEILVEVEIVAARAD